MDKVAILIPSYQPTESVVQVIAALRALCALPIIVVNDGSKASSCHYFEQVAQFDNIHMVSHAVNLGKGQSLKTGFNYFLQNFPDYRGVVTADADGQHLPKDIVAVCQQFSKQPQSLWIGSRALDKSVPWKSQLGNTVTRHVFKLLVGKKIHDTQSGLRGIPRDFMAKLLRVPAMGYEFELDMLVMAAQERLPVHEQRIDTVYVDDNRGSHFHPLLDSLRVYFVFIRFCGLSLLTALIDFIVFVIAYFISPSILTAMIAARLVAGTFNFMCGKWYIFKSRDGLWQEALKFSALVFVLMCISYVFIHQLVLFGMPVLLAKIFVEGGLFLLSFSAQRLLIFQDKNQLGVAT